MNSASVQLPSQIWLQHKTWLSGFHKASLELPYISRGFCVDSENTMYLPCI